MVNVFNAMSRGFNERVDLRNRQRREIANAFNEFRRANPEATLADFQSFIDAQAGSGLGSNYLRGGAPSKEILTKIASENAFRKKNRLEAEARDRVRARGDMRGYLQGQMDNALLNANPSQLDTAKNTWLQSLSPEGQELVTEMAILDGWTESKYNYLQGQRLRQSLPDLQNYLKLNQYSVDSLDPQSIAGAFGLDVSQVEPFIKAAKNETKMYMQRWWQENNAGIMEVANEAARQGLDDQAIKDAVGAYLTNSPQKKNFEAGEYDKLIASAVAKAKKVRDTELDQRTTTAQKNVALLEEAWDRDAKLAEAMRNGNQEEALAIMMKMAKARLDDDDWRLAYGLDGGESAVPDDFFKDQLSKIVETERNAQHDYYNERSQQFDSKIAEANNTFTSTNVQNMQNVFKSMFGDQPAGQLAQALGYEYVMSPQLAQSVMAAMSTLPEDVKKEAEEGNFMAAVNHIKSELEAAGMTPNLDQGRKAYIEGKKEENAIYQPMKFDDWLNQETDDFLADNDDYRKRMNEMVRAYQGNPDILADQLLKLQRAIQQTFNARVQEFETRKKRAYGRTGWILHNSGGWDDARVDDLLKSAKEATDAQLEAIQNYIANAQRDLAAKKAAEAENQAAAGGPVVQDETSDPNKTGFEEFLADSKEVAKRNQELRSVLSDNTTAFPFFTLTQDERAQQEIVSQFLGGQMERGAYRNYLLNNAPREVLDAFLQDPLQWIKQNEMGQEFLRNFEGGKYANLIPIQ
ncbi:MAG: hypothetical protein EBV86_04420 [Marivivens sp.]|nr:hypothetical protein [Marivivens sp.]